MATKIKLIADNAVTAAMIDTTATPTFGGITVNGDATVTGDLNITGNLNSYNVTDLDITDQTITLGAGQTEALSGGSGIIVDGSGASILWDETNTEWDFNKSVRIASDDTPTLIIESTDATNTAIIKFKPRSDRNVGPFITSTARGGSASDGDLQLGDENGTILTLNAGKVGIGAFSPATILDIQGIGGAASSPTVTATTGTNYIGWKSINTGGSFWTAIDNSTGTAFSTGTAYARVLWSNDAYPMVFSTNSTERMRIDSSGNVGIGTTSPNSYANLTTLAIGGKSSGGLIDMVNASYRIASIYSDSTASLTLNADPSSALASSAIKFHVDGPERARITSGGISIDTTNMPASTTGALVLANGGAGGPSSTQPGGGLWIEDNAGTPQLTLYRASGNALRLDGQGSNTVVFDNSGSYGWAFEHATSVQLTINDSNSGKTVTYIPIEAAAADDHFKSGVFYNVGENPINNPWHTCTQVNSSGTAGGTANCGDAVDTTGTITGCSQGTGSAYNWYSAKRYCELAGMRLCTRAEVIAGAGNGTGCTHNYRGQWTSTKGTTDSTKYFIVQGDGTSSSVTAEQENYPYDTTITGFTTNEIGIRCCQQNSWS